MLKNASCESLPCPNRSLFDPSFIPYPSDQMLDEDPGRDDVVRIDLAGLHEELHLRDRDPSGRRHDWIEIASGAMVDEITQPIPFPRSNESEIGTERLFEHIRLPVDDSGFLPFPNDRPIRGRREEPPDASAGSTNPLGKRPLRDQFDLELPGKVLSFELPILANI